MGTEVNTDNSVNENECRMTNDPFAYVNRTSFTSEKFKIEVRGLPKFYGISEFRKLLIKLKLKPCKIKPPKRNGKWVYVCFRSEEDRQVALRMLPGYKWKKKTLSVQIASAVPDPLVQKRCKNMVQNIKKNNKSFLSNEELLKMNTVPLWNIPYENQLEIKVEKIKTILKELSRELYRVNKGNVKIQNLLNERCLRYGGISCELSNIRKMTFESSINGYRNKCEFSIGMNEENGLKTIGFRFGSYVQGTTNVGSVTNLPHVSDMMKNIVQCFENFVRKNELDVYNPENHIGFWKQLTVRQGMNTNQTMVVISVNMDNIQEEVLLKIKSDIIDLFVKGEGRIYNITSLYLLTADFKTNKKVIQDTLELLHGSSTITEKLFGLEFSISPLSFFQTNTAATEVLYSAVKELTNLNQKTTLLDICCGIGSIGLCLAKSGAQILGIESDKAAIENAHYNCKQNNISNCAFFHGKAEDILSHVINKAVNNDIIAVLDPPRAGLHQKVITQLRRSKVKKMIFLSCNPKAALKNFITFGKPMSKTLFGAQFLPVKAIPVDNFPHTNHCELVMYFERVDSCSFANNEVANN